MPLSQKRRTQLHDSPAPIVGDDAIEALVSEFPAGDLDRPATQGAVRTDFAAVPGEMRTEFAADRGEMRTEFAADRGEICTLPAEARQGFAQFEASVAERFRAQTAWTASAVTAGMGLAAAIPSLSADRGLPASATRSRRRPVGRPRRSPRSSQGGRRPH